MAGEAGGRCGFRSGAFHPFPAPLLLILQIAFFDVQSEMSGRDLAFEQGS